MTVLTKTHIVRTKSDINFVATVDRHTQNLSIPSVSSVKVCFCEGLFSNPPKSWLEQWHPWRVLIGQWGPRFVPTNYEAYYCVIGHCVGIMAAHELSQMVVFATSHPTHPSPSHSTPSIINADDRKGWQKYHEIQPSEIQEVSYNKNK